MPPRRWRRVVAGHVRLPADARADDLRGAYRLELVASRGARTGDSTAAELELVLADDSLQSRPAASGLRDTTTRYPLVGWTTVDPAAVGATDTGPLGSRDPAAPGVLVIERQTRQAEAPKEILLRLGAEANRRDRLRFDGGYFALTVLRMDDERLCRYLGQRGRRAGGGRAFLRRAAPSASNGERRERRWASRRSSMEAQGIEPWSE